MGRRKTVGEIGRQKMKRDLLNQHLESSRSVAIKKIVQITAKIHKMTLSGDGGQRESYRLDVLKKALGELWWDKGYKSADWGGLYNTRYIKNLKDFQISFFLHPIEGYLPPIQIKIHPRRENISSKRYKAFLVWLNTKIPGLSPSEVEYTLDQFCREPEAVDLLFWLEVKSLWIPNRQTAVLYGGRQFSEGEKRGRTNYTVEIGTCDKKNESPIFHDRIYERGYDSDRIGKDWFFDDLKYVRLEHTANREELTDNGLSSLIDFILKPKFYKLNKDNWRFKKFKNSKKLRQDFQSYDPFQSEYTAIPDDVKRPDKNIKDEPGFSGLRSDLIEQMKKFGIEWKSLSPLLPRKKI